VSTATIISIIVGAMMTIISFLLKREINLHDDNIKELKADCQKTKERVTSLQTQAIADRAVRKALDKAAAEAATAAKAAQAEAELQATTLRAIREALGQRPDDSLPKIKQVSNK